MVKSETCQDAEILVRNPSPRLFGEKFRDSKKVKPNLEKTRLRDLSKTLPRFRDPGKIFRDPCFSRYHSPPLTLYPHCFPLENQYSQHLSLPDPVVLMDSSLETLLVGLTLSWTIYIASYPRGIGAVILAFIDNEFSQPQLHAP